MPRGDGTGGGFGRGGGRGRLGGNRAGAGPGGNCICPACGTKAPHLPAVPCFFSKCPKCGARMIRE